jgi:homoserine dehydrogenase
MTSSPIEVLKFGSSVLSGEDRLGVAVSEIYRRVREGRRVLAVVSALGDTTDRLLEAARRVNERAPEEELAALLTTGESTSAALLVLALDRAGIPARLLDPCRVGPFVKGPPLDAEPVGLDSVRILRAFERSSVAVLPGFFGRNAQGRRALLGRGGSDLTALFVAQQLEAARCVLFKDVPGIFEWDPAAAGAPPRRFITLSWEDAERLGSQVVQPKALAFASRHRHRLPFEVSAPGASGTTSVGSAPSRLERGTDEGRRLKVALLGLGTVGAGVGQHLAAWPERFELVGAAVRDTRRLRDLVPAGVQLFDSPEQLLQLPSDVVVEAMGGLAPAADLLAESLSRGRHVVTANKEVVVREGRRLERCAEEGNATLRYSAAVGGAVPALEAVKRLAQEGTILAIDGVLNGTSTFVLNRLADGVELPQAIREAQQRGLAEADPSQDLDGTDAVRKLILLAREAFGVRLDPAEVRCQGLSDVSPGAVVEARNEGRALRLVGSCRRVAGRVRARVRPVYLPARHPLAGGRDEENRVRIQLAGGSSVVLRGKGAGRWPTSEAVLADLLDLSRSTEVHQPLARLRLVPLAEVRS